jgi:predicted transcriptional regulator
MTSFFAFVLPFPWVWESRKEMSNAESLAGLHSIPMRSRVEIMASILSEARLSSVGLRKTRLMYRCNLSGRQLKVYLKLLIEKKLLRVVLTTEGKVKVEIYRVTKKGLAFLRSYLDLKTCLNEEYLAR